MTSQALHQKTVLVLNRHWLPVSAVSPADAFCHMVAGTADGLFISADSMLTLAWDAWRKLAVGDSGSIGTKEGRVRIPTVIVLSRFGGLPVCRPSFGFRALWERDGGRCQYSGRKLAVHEADIDHILPRSRGGRDAWDNCVISDRNINRRKGARTPEEARLTLIRKPSVPRAVPVTHTIENTCNINDWNHFIMK
ncbi:HNH endonuclease [Akkermansiaceae bacterium]|nr:HNH endonuclease [Akkermansiaceae bacterium]